MAGFFPPFPCHLLNKMQIEIRKTKELKFYPGNPRKISDDMLFKLRQSMREFGLVDPLIVNKNNEVIGGNQRLKAAIDEGINEVPVTVVELTKEKEKALNLALNKIQGEWDDEQLKIILQELNIEDVKLTGFSDLEIENIFLDLKAEPEQFDLEKELRKLKIDGIKTQKEDVYKLGEHRLMCGDSTNEENVVKLMNGEKADMCFTDPPYILDYLSDKRHGKPTEGFGAKQNRRYLETDVLPPDFTAKWMGNINKIQKKDFSIIVFENWKNIRTIWNEVEKYWKVRNMIVWHLPNRHQGFPIRHGFFSKYDIAVLGTTKQKELNTENEEELIQNEYETAFYATSGKPYWEKYEKGKKIMPTDFIEYSAANEKSSGQGIIFGTKPIEILIPYMKVLTKQNDLIIEPFGGAGSTLITAQKLKRKCYVMEKMPIYCEVIINRWEKFTGQKAEKL